jgi:glucose/arabinose dehydrogenase
MSKSSIAAILLLLSTGIYAQVSFTSAYPNLTFTNPVFLTHAGDGSNRVFVVEKGGYIRVFANDSNVSSYQTFLNVTNLISTNYVEKGLLGMAFHPNYTSNRYFYIYYTRLSDGAITISRFTTMSGNPNKADSLSEYNIITVLHPTNLNHNGGNLMFGQDGYLYTGLGDGGSAGDPPNNAQNVNVLLGKILRLDINSTSGGNHYAIPPTNPFAGGGGAPEIFTWGMRNPWRFSQDITGIIYCADVGQDAWEEIDTLWNGKNYGWRCYEGNHTYNTSGCGPISNYTFPIKEYQNIGAACSITGGFVYRGTRVPWLVGRYVYGDYCSRNVWKLYYNAGAVSDTALIGATPSGASILSFGKDQNGEEYVCCGNGVIYKFVNTLIGINNNNNSVPIGFNLEQNFPNPFNPSTEIKYSLQQQGRVNIKIYDVLGNEVAQLVNETKQPGNYSIKWDALNFPSSVYIYRMTVNDYTVDKKMVLMK